MEAPVSPPKEVDGQEEELQGPGTPSSSSTATGLTRQAGSASAIGSEHLNVPITIGSNGVLYRPLNTSQREIRVVFLPAGSLDEPLHLRLMTISLAAQGKYQYTGLSYAWGDDAPATEEIRVNGIAVNITKNLHQALRNISAIIDCPEPDCGDDIDYRTPDLATHLRQSLAATRIGPDEQKETFDCVGTCLWVDSLCINQSDVNERNQQVQVMSDIFSNAFQVISWLGCDEQAELALKTIGMLGAGVEKNKASGIIWSDATFLNEIPALHNQDPELKPDDNYPLRNRFWDSLTKLNDNLYWQRVWIAQEVVLASHVWFMSRGEAVHEQLFSMFLGWQAKIQRSPPDKPGMMDPNIWWRLTSRNNLNVLWITRLMNLRYSLSNAGRQNKLFVLPDGSYDQSTPAEPIISTIDLQSTEPRDKVYALLGMYEPGLQVDYQKTPSEVYEDFFRFRLEKTGQPFLLAVSGMPVDGSAASSDHRPSWVPDFHMLSTNSDKQETFRLFLPALTFPGNGGAGRVKDGAVGAAKVSVEGRSLRLSALPCGNIATIEGAPAYDRFAKLCTQFVGITKPRKPYPSGIPRLRAIYELFLWQAAWNSTGVGQSFAEMHQLFDRYIPPFLRYVVNRALKRPIQRNDFASELSIMTLSVYTGIEVGEEFLDDIQEELFGDLPLPAEWEGRTDEEILYSSWDERAKLHDITFDVSANWVLQSCAVFQTSAGYLGVGPLGLKESDLLIVIPEYPYPTALRLVDGKWRHVGPCYIVGMMEGEMLSELDEGAVKLQQYMIY
jgi:hypothetical protein